MQRWNEIFRVCFVSKHLLKHIWDVFFRLEQLILLGIEKEEFRGVDQSWRHEIHFIPRSIIMGQCRVT